MNPDEFQEFWDNFIRDTAYEHRTRHLHYYAAGNKLTDEERQALVELGWLTANGRITAAGRAWLADQGLHLEVTDTALYRRLWPMYCGPGISSEKRRVPEPLYYANRHWLCTGGTHGVNYHEARGSEVLSPAEFAAQYPAEPVRGREDRYFGPHGYAGCQVWHGQQAWIITERTLTVQLAPGDPERPPAPPQQLALF